MVISYCSHLRRFSLWITRGIQKIQEPLVKKFRNPSRSGYQKHKDAIYTVGFLALALILGYWANLNTAKEAILKWERTYRPSPEIVDYALGSRRMNRLKDSQPIQWVLRSLPTSLDDFGSIWMSSDSNWVAYYSNPAQTLQPQIHCLECSTRPAQWQPMGVGWRALEKVIQILDAKPQVKREVKKKPPPLLKDPRELVY